MVYVIAEAGACGDGDLAKMIRQVNEAASSGANAVKFQYMSNALKVAERRHATEDGYQELYRKYCEWPREWHGDLQSACVSAGVDYMCSVYLKEDVLTVAPYVSNFKVSSFEANDYDLLNATARTMRPPQRMLVSTGMCGDTEYRILVDRFRIAINAQEIVLMHCVSSYPTPLSQLNLSVLSKYKQITGFSDHSDPSFTFTGALAVSCGAKFIEAHMRLDDTDVSNPDAPHAMTPEQFDEYVELIRNAEFAIGSGRKGEIPCEKLMKRYRV